MAKILIIEDEPSYQKILHHILVKNNYQVFQANNGQIGLSIALNQKPDLILLDIRMPIMDGLTMLKKLRTDESYGKQAKVILLTNYDSDNEILANISETLPVYYLIKANTRLDDLLDKIKEVLSPAPTVQ